MSWSSSLRTFNAFSPRFRRLLRLGFALALIGAAVGPFPAAGQKTGGSVLPDLHLEVTEMLPYQIGCERRDDDPIACNPGCQKPDEQGYVTDPSANLAYYPTALSLGGGRYDVLVQTGCRGDFLDRFTVDLAADEVDLVNPLRDLAPSTCNGNFPEVMGSADLLAMESLPGQCGKVDLGANARISFFTFGNSDIWRGRLAFAHATNGSNWNIVKDRFLLYPLCAGSTDVCEELGVAGAAALEVGNYYYVYPYLFNNPSSSLGTMLLRFEKTCTAPFLAFEPGGGQIFDTVTKTWVDLAFDPSLGYTLEICPSLQQDVDRYLLIPNGTGIAVTHSPTDGYLLTHKKTGAVLRYLRASEPTFDGGDAPSYVIDASLLDDFFRYQLCPGGVAPANPSDPCVYDWDMVNHHAELEPGPGAGEYTMFFTRMNTRDGSQKFRFSSARMARVKKNPSFTPLLPPSGTQASDGTFAQIVRVTWNPVPGATQYEIWRHPENKPASAVRIATVPQTTQYDDDTVGPGTLYHYWIRAKNSQTTGSMGPSDSGRSGGMVCSGLFHEAENGVLTGDFQVSTAGSVTFVEVPDGAVGGAQAPNENQKASYCFQVPAPGTYRIATRVRGQSHGADSFWVRVDGAPATPYLWVPRPLGSWVDDYVDDYNVQDPVEVTLSAGNHVVDVLLREDGTQLDSIALEPVPSNCGGLSQQAEQGELSGAFEVATLGAVTYVHVPDGAIGGAQAPNEANKASYCFQVTTGGTYRIKARVWGVNHGADSFWVRMDDLPPTPYLWVVSPLNAWIDDYVNDYNTQDPVEIVLPPGEHHLDVILREDGTRLDSITLELQ